VRARVAVSAMVRLVLVPALMVGMVLTARMLVAMIHVMVTVSALVKSVYARLVLLACTANCRSALVTAVLILVRVSVLMVFAVNAKLNTTALIASITFAPSRALPPQLKVMSSQIPQWSALVSATVSRASVLVVKAGVVPTVLNVLALMIAVALVSVTRKLVSVFALRVMLMVVVATRVSTAKLSSAPITALRPSQRVVALPLTVLVTLATGVLLAPIRLVLLH